MGNLKNTSDQDNPIKSYSDFWEWFAKNAEAFFTVVDKRGDIEKDFFDKMSEKLRELEGNYMFLTGMRDPQTAELVFTADGDIRNIVFVEELVAAAPLINGWQFIALKPALNLKNMDIQMAGFMFNQAKISFYANESSRYPDEIDITIIHEDWNADNSKLITNGVYIFLDNYLGELEFLQNIDHLSVKGRKEAVKELVPISKLKDFLIWRQKEFVEKYEGIRYDTENDSYSMFEADQENDKKLLAVINTELLQWDSQASHPWIYVLLLKYGEPEDDGNGMPDTASYELIKRIEEEAMLELKCADGYLNLGRQTAEGLREVYFACKDFRKPSKVFTELQLKHQDRIEVDYEVYKDKYWKSFERFLLV